MAVVRTSTRAFFAAWLVLAAFHGVMLVLGLGMFLAEQLPPPSPDRALQIFLLRVGIDAALLYAGHYLLRSFALGTRAAYGLMGGAAAAIGYAFALSRDLLISPPLDGTRFTAGVLPVLVGMTAGLLYNKLAGREMRPARNGAAGTADVAVSTAPIHFDGPVQVRTSLAATAIAAAVPAAIVALVSLPFLTWIFGYFSIDTPRHFNWSVQLNEMMMPAYLFMVTLLASALPAAIVVGVTHAIARGMGRLGRGDYAAIGAAVSGLASLALVMIMPGFLVLPVAVLSGAAMGAVYRWFAGLEPLALPEIVLATDRATLVGEDDPTRRTRAVIMNG